jgi:hypothetical protein
MNPLDAPADDRRTDDQRELDAVIDAHQAALAALTDAQRERLEQRDRETIARYRQLSAGKRKRGEDCTLEWFRARREVVTWRRFKPPTNTKTTETPARTARPRGAGRPRPAARRASSTARDDGDSEPPPARPAAARSGVAA